MTLEIINDIELGMQMTSVGSFHSKTKARVIKKGQRRLLRIMTYNFVMLKKSKKVLE